MRYLAEGGRIRRAVLLFVFLLPCAALGSGQSPSVIRYAISLANPGQHLIRVKIEIPPGAIAHDLQLPVWNGLYQVRDFAQYVDWVRGKSPTGQPLSIRKLDKSSWRLEGAQEGAEVEYEVFADDPGPFGAQLNTQHAFFNLAEILMYPEDARSLPIHLRFDNVPSGWRAATALSNSSGEFSADNYDRLVDAPVEIGRFEESDFDQGGAHYRVVVDANSAEYDMRKIVDIVRQIVATETDWMDERPLDGYLFLYHVVRDGGGIAMEHADSTAIEINASALAHDPQSLADLTAHEFFHLWNVKRIRPQSLEPIDYTRENYTNTLWFVEGVTTTVADYIRLRAGLLDESRFLQGLVWQVKELEQRPAHLTQSAEESSLDAWLEKYSYYSQPQRSISYYNKGYLLGILLDLEIREASNRSASLRDLFLWLNQHYAHEGRPFPDSDGVRQAAEAVTHADFGAFFEKYVAGADEIPWDDFFKTIGFRLERKPGREGQFDFELKDVDNITPQQKARRAAWLKGESEPSGDPHR